MPWKQPMKTACLAVLTGLVLVACGSAPATEGEHNRAAVSEADGGHVFYAGRGVGDAIAGGRPVGGDFPSPFMALRVSAAMYDAAMQAPQRVKTVSLEVPDSSIEITVHQFVRGSATLETLHFHPADPWVTGYAQVGTPSDDFTMGFFEVIKWNKDPSGTMPSLLSEEIHTTGLLPDGSEPVLLYADDPTKVPLPANWN